MVRGRFDVKHILYRIIKPDKLLINAAYRASYYLKVIVLFRSYALNLYERTLRKILNGNS